MPLTTRAAAHNTIVKFALEGATLSDAGNVIEPSGYDESPTTVGRNAKPSAADTTWVQLSGVMKAELQNDNGQAQEVWENIPGVGTELYEQFRTGRKRIIKLTCQRLQPLTVQLLRNSTALGAASGQFNPHSSLGEVNGWLNVAVYDHRGTEIYRLDQWCELVLDGGLTFDPKTKTDPVYTATGLYNELNTETLSPA